MDATALIKAQYIDCGRSPASPGARGLTGDILQAILPHLQSAQERPIGPKAIHALRENLGAVLAGLMRAGGSPVRAPRGKASDFWGRGGTLNYDAFWKIVDALKAAEFVGERKGLKGSTRGITGAYAAALWPLPMLMDRAAGFQVTPATRKADWGANTSVIAQPGRKEVGVRIKPWVGVPLAAPEGCPGEREAMEAGLVALNALNASVVIRGGGAHLSLHRSFRHSLAFGGRFWGAAYLRYSDTERLGITFDGEPAAEVDVKASQLTVLHGLTGNVSGDFSLPRQDLYALDGLPRAAVKEWMKRTLGRGTVRWGKLRWEADVPAEVRATPVRAVRDAMVAAYPFLSDLEAVVPRPILAAVPEGLSPKDRAIAIGQYVTSMEARALAGAVAYCVARGVPALPVHDALIVPLSRIRDAEDALRGAYLTLAGVVPRLEIATGA